MSIGRNTSERGASAVEMALVAPFLFLVLLGIIEFGYLFGEYNEVRHAAREGARIAAVSNVAYDQDADGNFDGDDIRDYVCSVLALPSGTVTIDLDWTTNAIGQEATIDVSANVNSLSGAPFISSFIPSNLSNVATFRLEQPASWVSTYTGTC
jgi:Flp pilus assembly protein TadG